MKYEGLDYSSPVTFTLRERVVLATATPLIAYLVKFLGALARVELRGEEHIQPRIDAGEHCLIAVWHEAICMGLSVFAGRNVHSLTSYSFDGELAARLARYFDVEVIRGSTSHGGFRALRQLEKAARLSPLIIITVDGPRGPRRVAQPGLAIISARTQLPIFPVAMAAHPAWRLNSWDKTCIPKPFAKMICAYGEPIPPPDKAKGRSIEETRQQLESDLNALQESIQRDLGCPEA